MNAFLSQLPERLGWALLHSLWQGLAIGLLLAAYLQLGQRHRPAKRCGACVLAMVLCGACFIQTAISVRLPQPRPSASVQASPPLRLVEEASLEKLRPDPASTTAGAANASKVAAVPSSSPAPVLSAPRPINWQEWITPWISNLALVWIIGVTWLCLRHAVGWQRIRGWRRRGAEPEADLWAQFGSIVARCGIRGKVALKVSGEVLVPVLTGFLRPMVLLPARLLSGLTAAETEAIFAHELAHLARRDTWINLVQVLLETILFYHPAIRWMSRRAREERELATDDLALHFGPQRHVYARALVRIAEQQSLPDFSLGATGGSLLRRVRRILLPEPREPMASLWPLPAMSGAVVVWLSVLLQAGAQTAPVITVKAGESLQKAIDAALPGAVVRVGEGEWNERIVITKPLTLEGAGWDKTLLRPTQLPAEVAQERKRWMDRKAVRPDSADALAKDWAGVFDPTVTIRGVKGVTVRGFKVQGLPVVSDANQGLYPYMLVLVDQAEATVKECTMTGYYIGITVRRNSIAHVEGCTMAALWHTGVKVDEGGTLHLRDADVRNCHYAGLVIGRGCDDTTIENSRISGAAWHGIRWDDASPAVTGCAIFGNERAGIYVGGRSNLHIRNNVFWRNGGAVTAGPGNTGLIQGNVIFSSGIFCTASLHLRIADNIIAGSGEGLSLSFADGKGGRLADERLPEVTGNLFWQNKTDFQVGGAAAPLPGGNQQADPRFTDAANGDFTRQAGAPLVAKGATANLSQPPPLLAEERAIVPEGNNRDSTQWKVPGARSPRAAQERQMAAYNQAQPLVKNALQIEDLPKRNSALASVKQELASGDREREYIALLALSQLQPLSFDKASYRPLVRKLLASDQAEIRAAAVIALMTLGHESEDLPRLFAMANDPAPEVRDVLTHPIVTALKGDLTGPDATKAILKLMDQMPADPRSIAHALWGAKFSPQLEERVLQYCQDVDGDLGYVFFYGSLSTQANKSEASCRRLIEILTHPDPVNRVHRAAWGLRQGVAKEQYGLVASAMLKLMESRELSSLDREIFACLENYGGSAQLEGIDRLLAKPGLPDATRKQLEGIRQKLAAVH